MKVKVINSFNDLENNLLTRNVGDVYDCSDERATELNKLGFVEFAEPKPKEETKRVCEKKSVNN
ncbi:MAG: hypothetical protein PUC69_03075 [Ruminococcus sp.]|nr:hypothetical protein [Ruminococcus sp.]MDD5889582.1 hypothetical protein [Ruminococcus sp.]